MARSSGPSAKWLGFPNARPSRSDFDIVRQSARVVPKLTNDGHDTRALQHYLGHRNIQHTVRYTELAPERFKGFWPD